MSIVGAVLSGSTSGLLGHWVQICLVTIFLSDLEGGSCLSFNPFTSCRALVLVSYWRGGVWLLQAIREDDCCPISPEALERAGSSSAALLSVQDDAGHSRGVCGTGRLLVCEDGRRYTSLSEATPRQEV